MGSFPETHNDPKFSLKDYLVGAKHTTFYESFNARIRENIRCALSRRASGRNVVKR